MDRANPLPKVYPMSNAKPRITQSSNAVLLCPFCQGRVQRVEENPQHEFNAGAFLLADFLFWSTFGIALVLGLWNWIAGFAVLVLVVVPGWMRRDRRSSAYRCESCQSVLSYAEIFHPHGFYA